MRLMPRGLRIHYAADGARACTTTGWISTASPRGSAGPARWPSCSTASIPGTTTQLQVRWMADLVAPALDALRQQPDLLRHVEAFDAQTDRLLRAFAGFVWRGCLRCDSPDARRRARSPADRGAGPALHNVLRTIFDVERTRGKVREWYAGVDDPRRCGRRSRSALRAAEDRLPHPRRGGARVAAPPMAAFDAGMVAGLRATDDGRRIRLAAGRFHEGAGVALGTETGGSVRRYSTGCLARIAGFRPICRRRPAALARMRYRRVRSRVRKALG